MISKASRSSLVSVVCAIFSVLPTANALAKSNGDSDVPTDEILAQCSQNSQSTQSSCVRDTLSRFINRNLKTVSYSEARHIVFSKIDTYHGQDGHNTVDSVYSTDSVDMDQNANANMPRNSEGKSFNIEHTWPQSYLKQYNRFDQARADMFHLFPVEEHINSERGNLPFRDCNDNSQNSTQRVSNTCDGGFEPPAQHRGKVARAMFYMAVTYNMKIDATQEQILRKWNEEFPVTDSERERDSRIHEVEGVHNPFILHPEWVSRISDF